MKYGQILFVPDTSKGNSGPAGTATIRDGFYDTSKGGKGTVGGAVIARLTGQDTGPMETTSDEPGAVLFRDYEVELDLPKQASTKDFDVPADAAKAKPAKKPVLPAA